MVKSGGLHDLQIWFLVRHHLEGAEGIRSFVQFRGTAIRVRNRQGITVTFIDSKTQPDLLLVIDTSNLRVFGRMHYQWQNQRHHDRYHHQGFQQFETSHRILSLPKTEAFIISKAQSPASASNWSQRQSWQFDFASR